MTQSEHLATVIRELTRDFPLECLFGEYGFTALKGFNTPLGFETVDSGYEDNRPEEFYVMADEFTAEDPAPGKTDEITADGDTFKIMAVDCVPTKAAPLFYKFRLILIDSEDDEE